MSGERQTGRLADCDCLIFDVDGVIIDTAESFPETIRRCAREMWEASGGVADGRYYTPEMQAVFKRHGSFNDDYDIAWALLNIAASAGGAGGSLSQALPAPADTERLIAHCGGDCVGWVREEIGERFPRGEVRALCEAIYFGEGGREPASALERPLLGLHWRELPLPAFIYTGRDLREWRAGQRVLGWEDFPDERVVHRGTGMMKPSPAGIEHICREFSRSRPAYFGDTASDRGAARASGGTVFIAIGQLLADEPLRFDTIGEAIGELIMNENGVNALI